jgi:large subunit ribosomal protein L5
MEKFGYKNALQAPRIEKIVINIGAGEGAQDKKKAQSVITDLTAIAGQKAVTTYSKKAIANFKIRKGDPVGARVTLRHDRMYEFLDRLVTRERVLTVAAITPWGSRNTSCFSKSTTTRPRRPGEWIS